MFCNQYTIRWKEIGHGSWWAHVGGGAGGDGSWWAHVGDGAGGDGRWWAHVGVDDVGERMRLAGACGGE